MTAIFPVKAELQIDGVWVDVSDRLREAVPIQRGREDEASHVQPSAGTLVLYNNDGALTPHSVHSQWYPHVKRGMLARVTVTANSVPYVRQVGRVEEISLQWPLPRQRTDTAPSVATVTMVVSGFLREFSRTQDPIGSALTRFLTAKANEQNTPLMGWWPLEDDGPTRFERQVIGARPGAGFALSPMKGVQPMHLSEHIDYAADDSFPASSTAVSVSLGNGFGYNAMLPRRTSSTWQINLFVNINKTPGTFLPVVLVYIATSGRAAYWVQVGSSFWQLIGRDTATGQTLFTDNLAIDPLTHQAWVLLSVRLRQSGSSLAHRMQVEPLLTGEVFSVNDSTASTTLGRVTGIHNYTRFESSTTTDGTLSFCHLIVSNNVDVGTAWLEPPATAFYNETAAHRIHRLCTEESVPITVVGDSTAGDPFTPTFRGDPDASEPMGFQRPKTMIDLLRECADTDGGILYEARDALGLEYRTRQSMVNQPAAVTLDMAQRGLAEPFEPASDDQGFLNAATVKRPDGSSRTYDASTSPLDRYSDEFERNLATDRPLRTHAAWLVGLGSWPDLRWRGLGSSMRAAGSSVTATWAAADLGDRILTDNLPAQVDESVDFIMQGYSEVLSEWHWRVTLNASPAGPWTAGITDGSGTPNKALARLDTDGSSLAANITTTTTSFNVSINEGPPWSTSSTYLPARIIVGGEEMSVTTIGTHTPAGAVFGGAQFGGSATTSHVAPSVVAVGTTNILRCFWCSTFAQGNYSFPGGMSGSEIDGVSGGFDATFATAAQNISSSGATGTRTATFSTSDTYSAASILLHGSGGFPVQEATTGLLHATDGVIETSITASEGEWLLAVQAWNLPFNLFDLMPPPSGGDWQLVANSGHATSSNASQVKAWAKRITAETAGTHDIVFGWTDGIANNHNNFAVVYAYSGINAGTQQFTVTRSVNGVVRAHTKGAAVNVADPFRLRL